MTKRILNLRNAVAERSRSMVKMIVACLAVITMFSGCKPPVNPPDDPDNPAVMVNLELKGIVNDINGNPLSGVKVTTGTKSANTGADGTFNFTQAEVVNNRVIVKFAKSGYFAITRSGNKPEKDMFIDAVLCPKGNSDISTQTSFNSSEGAVLTVGDMVVTIPPAALMSKDKTDYNGTVNANMLYLDPSNPKYCYIMPGGDHLGTDKTGKDVMLLSLGLCRVELTDNAGKRLFLKNGFTAHAIYPVPEGAEDNLPDAIPVSKFNTKKGIWEEKRMATRISRTSEKKCAPGNYGYDDLAPLADDDDLAPLGDGDDLAPLGDDDDLAPLTHNWITAKGKVVDCKGKPVQGARVTITGGQVENGPLIAPTMLTSTNISGEYTLNVEDCANFGVHASANNGYDDYYWIGVPKGKWTCNVPDLKVPCESDGWGTVRGMNFYYSEALWQPNTTGLMIYNPNDAPNSGDYVIINFKNVPLKLPPGTYTYTNGLNEIASFGVWINDEIILATWAALGCTLTLEKNASDNTYSISFSGKVAFFDAPGVFEAFELFYRGQIDGLD